MTPLPLAPIPQRRFAIGAACRIFIVPLLIATSVSLGGCGLYHPVTAEDRDATATCNAEVDRVFAAQNRYQLSERDQSNSPYSADTLPNNPSAGLSDRYQQDQMVDKCLARSAGGVPASEPVTSPAKP